jgi:hypothetical protein
MINEINERLRAKIGWIARMERELVLDDAQATAVVLTKNEVAFLERVLQYVDVMARELQSERELNVIRSETYD